MPKKRLFTIAAAVAICLFAVTAPAFTADNASLSVTVTAQPIAVPCVMFAASPGTEVDFGTLPFLKPNVFHTGFGSVSPRFSNCGMARENLFIAATDAHNECTGICASHTWRLGDGNATAGCPNLNGYQLWYLLDNVALGDRLQTTNIPLRNLGAPNQPYDYAVGEAHDLRLQIQMPCEGSDGAGELFTLAVTVTAVVP